MYVVKTTDRRWLGTMQQGLLSLSVQKSAFFEPLRFFAREGKAAPAVTHMFILHVCICIYIYTCTMHIFSSHVLLSGRDKGGARMIAFLFIATELMFWMI